MTINKTIPTKLNAQIENLRVFINPAACVGCGKCAEVGHLVCRSPKRTENTE
ncbi:MAG: 4Fe-4S binding protein [Promethearchaeota archaeon]